MLFGIGQSLRSLTASPIATALDQAHRMAQQRLHGGSVSASDDHHGDFVLPADVDPRAVAIAIEGKLRGNRGSAAVGSHDALSPLKRIGDGRVAVPSEFVKRLGGGDNDRGKRFLDRVIDETRATPGAATR